MQTGEHEVPNGVGHFKREDTNTDEVTCSSLRSNQNNANSLASFGPCLAINHKTFIGDLFLYEWQYNFFSAFTCIGTQPTQIPL